VVSRCGGASSCGVGHLFDVKAPATHRGREISKIDGLPTGFGLFSFTYEHNSFAAGTGFPFRLAVACLDVKSKFQDEAHFKILRQLHENPELSQREIGERVGISLGAVNYCLKALVFKGLVKANNFSRSPSKIRYVYQLTPAGIARKGQLTGKFLKRKLAEYEALGREIEALTLELPAGPRRDE
jgi:EPS-associated MarR family transcriptional regulator